MAQLKDLLVTGASRLIGDAYTNTIQITSLKAPTSAGGSTYGTGTNGQVLLSNGSSIYWGSAAPTVTESTVSGWGFTKNTGTITGATANKGLTVSGTTLGHSNSVTAQTTQAIYPIKIDAQGHISAYGTAVTPLTASSTLDATKLNGTIPTSCYTNTTYSAGTGLSLSGTTFNHSNSITAGTVSDGGNARTLAFGGTFKIPSVTYDAQGHITSTSTITLTMPANPNSNTATAADNILDGSNSGTQITYAPYSSQQSKLSFDTSTTNPTRSDRLNLNGYLYATKLYSGGSEVLTSHQSLSGYIPKSIGTAAGDIIYWSAASTPTRLTKGSDGQVLKLASGVPTWAADNNTTYNAGDGLRLSGTSFINTRIPFVVGTQTAATGTWTGVCNDITSLYDGLTIAYWLPYAGSGNATLNLTINGTATGAKNCYYSGTNRLTTHYAAGNIIYLTYRSAGNVNGTNYEGWWAQGQYDSNTVSQVRWDYSTATAGTAGIFPYTLIMMNNSGNYESIVTSSSTGTSKARNTAGFIPGRISLMYANTTVTNGNKISSSNYTIFDAYSGADGRYSFNISNTGLTVGKPLYLVGTITNGLFYLDTTWWTQTLPTTADNKVYMYIGSVHMPYNTTSDYRFNLGTSHPMFQYINGALRLYSGTADYAATAGSATKATQDASGNTITSTYVKKSEITKTSDVSITFSNSDTATVSVTGVTTSNTVIVSPTPDEWQNWGDYGIRCSAQASGSLTFTASNSIDLTTAANIVILP